MDLCFMHATEITKVSCLGEALWKLKTNLIKLNLCLTDYYQGLLPGVLKAEWVLLFVLVDDLHSDYCTRALKVKLQIFMLDLC